MKFVYDSDKDQRIKDLEQQLAAANWECQQWQIKCQMLQNHLNASRVSQRGFTINIGPGQGVQAESLPKDLLERLIAFCHPDRHENSDKANKLTQELLKLRK